MNGNFILAMLEGFGFLNTAAELLDKKVMDIAVSSSGFDGIPRQTMNDVKAINELTDRKINLINLKTLILDMVTKLPYKYRLLAKYRYLNGFKAYATAKMLGISLRTVFRWSENLGEECVKILTDLGYDDKLFEKYWSEKWLAALVRQTPTRQTPKKKKQKILNVHKLYAETENNAFIGKM